ncbi:hypothetical protein L5515_011908 [Caenorhabditis briggsae]|uniref:Conserved oligomeric Golgi complex subunit 8 n=1 Tax=Caenorhabditis briggsae TaxID=6238 RepID=A0AAE9JHM6_CAEBR|nr:hypothetical protein L5515_011908 [Caenorhabditis briggsae]
MIVQAIETYRTSMYDTLVLYLAVFPENEIVRKNPNADPRWESWPVLPPNSILSQWVISNVKKMLDLITKADVKSAVDLSAVWTKLMAMASSFGRMGIDFRPLIAGKLTKLVEQRFRQNVQDATNRLTGSSRDIVMIGIDPASLPQFESTPDAPPVAAAELSLWDEMTIYTNGVVDALNGLRFILTPVILSTVVVSLRDSIRSILTWLATSHSNSANFTRAVRIVCTSVAPFFEKCIAFFFPPATISKIFGSSISKHQYLQFIEFDMKQLAASCDGADKIEDIVKPLLQKKTLEEIGLESVLQTKPHEEMGPTKFFLEPTPEEQTETHEAEQTNQSMKNTENHQNTDVYANSTANQEERNITNEEVLIKSEETAPIDEPSTDEAEQTFEEPDNDSIKEEVLITQTAPEPHLETIREDKIVEEPASNEEMLTEPIQDDAFEKEEGWGWGEEETPIKEDEAEVSIPKKKGGKNY